MFKFVGRTAARASPPHNLYNFLPIPHFSSSSLHPIQNSPNQHSFTVNYLINSFGFSPEEALSASKQVKFEAPQKPDSVISFFKNHGLTQTQISSLIRKVPLILVYDPRKTLLPKLQFLKSKGFSAPDVARIVYAWPVFLKRGLENVIIPSFDFCRNLLQSQEETIAAIKRCPRLLLFDELTRVTPNIEILKEACVPNANIMSFLMKQPRPFMMSSDRFRQIVEVVEKMGFNPSNANFVWAIHALAAMSKSTWENKVEVYKKWGWTEDETLVAFKKHPWCMIASEDKINRVMDFFVNEVGWESLSVARSPILLSLSLEKRIIPRFAVYQVLSSKGVVQAKGVSLTTLLKSSEKQFLERYVDCYEEEYPELFKLYKEKLELAT